MKSIKTLETKNLCESAKNGGCGECQTSCQSACKTSCGIANQQCENKNKYENESVNGGKHGFFREENFTPPSPAGSADVPMS